MAVPGVRRVATTEKRHVLALDQRRTSGRAVPAAYRRDPDASARLMLATDPVLDSFGRGEVGVRVHVHETRPDRPAVRFAPSRQAEHDAAVTAEHDGEASVRGSNWPRAAASDRE